MQKISCPSCGGEVEFRSAASVMAVCTYCHSTLLKDAESVKDIGKVSALLEDYSRLQILSAGRYNGNRFAAVGRIQLRYDAGFWNEWHVLFDDGSSGWLSDASGQYVLTVPIPPTSTPLPAFDTISPGHPFLYGDTTFFAADVRTAHCISWEGELPFRVDTTWEAKVADFRSGKRFLSLDYSDSAVPQLFAGKSVTLEQLTCELLRDADAVLAASGRFKGQTVALDCPSCGASIKYATGMAFHLVCPSCHAAVDCSEDKALVLQKADEIDAMTTTLSLGDVGTIGGVKYDVMGLLQCRAGGDEQDATWVEYLLFNPTRDFLWLVESDDGWDRAEVLNEWPTQPSAGSVMLNGETFNLKETYRSEVTYAAGAFNWRVSVGDKTTITDFSKGTRKLSSETNASEAGWSLSRRVEENDVRSWFNKKPVAAAPLIGNDVLPMKPAIWMSAFLALFNIPISFGTGMTGLKVIFCALVILWAPVIILRYLAKRPPP